MQPGRHDEAKKGETGEARSTHGGGGGKYRRRWRIALKCVTENQWLRKTTNGGLSLFRIPQNATTLFSTLATVSFSRSPFMWSLLLSSHTEYILVLFLIL
jgi:hypothetical protein